MSELKDAEMALYDDRIARPSFYNEAWNFDPLQYLRPTPDEEGRVDLTLDIKYRRHWFRLVHPHGQIRIHEKVITPQSAMFTARVYEDKSDDLEQFLAEGTAIRYYGPGKIEKYYVDWAETMSIGRALTAAGFDVPWCNKPTDKGVMNLYTGETITYEDDASSASGAKRQYPDVTAPPPDGSQPEPAAQPQAPPPASAPAPAPIPAQQQAAASGPPASAPAPTPTPAQQQAAASGPPASAPTPAPTPAQQQAESAAQAAQATTPQTPASAGQNPASNAVQLPTGNTANTLEEALATLDVDKAKAIIIPFGKNKGKTLGQIAIESPSDIDWLINKYGGKNYMIQAGAKILADAALSQAG